MSLVGLGTRGSVNCGSRDCSRISVWAAIPMKTSLAPLTTKHRIYTMTVASVYPHYVAKAEKKGRKKAEVDAVICWLTGYSPKELKEQLKKETNFETFFAEAPQLDPARSLIKGTICGCALRRLKSR